MKCYKHQDRDAIGLCKSCHKGVCPECSVLVGDSIACADSCQENVDTLSHITERNKEIYKSYTEKWSHSIIVYSAGGAVFISLGLYNPGKIPSWLLITFGIIIIISGIIISTIRSKYLGKKNQ